MTIYNLVSLCGYVALIALAWGMSADRQRLNWRVLAWGTVLQLALGFLVFAAPGSTRVFLWLNDGVVQVLQAATQGQYFVFGALSVPPGATGAAGEKSLGFFLAFQVLPIIIFVAAVMGLLYYWRIMPRVIRGFAWLFTRLMRISGAESLCAASNIFVGIESVTTIRPYLARMTHSEFCTVLTAGMATVASSTLGLYVFMLKDTFPTIAGHLISASLLSAPAAIMMSKVLLPEDGQPLTLGQDVDVSYARESSAVEAVINGAMAGVKLVVGVAALLIAFLGLIGVVNLALGWLAAQCGSPTPVTLEGILGWFLSPFAAIMGVPLDDSRFVGTLLSKRLIATEVPAYQDLAVAMKAGTVSARAAMISAYALCGFAHIASLAIFVGGTAALVPERRSDLAKVGPRALLAATLACLLTGAVAGIFFHGGLTALNGRP